MPSQSAAVVISTRIGLNTAEPYIDQLVALGYAVRVYCLGEFDDMARSLWVGRPIEILGPSSVPVPWWASLHQLCVITFSRLRPGLNADQRLDWSNRSAVGSGIRRYIRWLFSRFDASTVNRWLSVAGRATSSPFAEDVAFVITTSTRPWLHTAGRTKTISVIESWDHPVRKTAGYRTDAVIAWNRAIGRDWQQFQGSVHSHFIGGPHKLAYAIDAFPLEHSSEEEEKPRLLYAIGTCTASPDWYDSEFRLIEMIIDAADEAGWEVTLKRKPNGGLADFVDLAERHHHVSMTGESASPNPMDYYLDDEYNSTRLAELSKVDLVVNSVTTFALDAACAGLPVLQLGGFGGPELAGLRSAALNYHLQAYLLNDPSQMLEVESGTIRQTLSEWLREPDGRAVAYSERIRGWLVPPSGLDRASRGAVTASLAAVGLPTTVSIGE